MSDIAAELKTYLKTIKVITDVIGKASACKMMLHQARQTWAAPFVVYDVLADDSFEDLTGSSGLIISHIQIDSHGSTSVEAHSLAELIRTALMITNGIRYTMGSTYIHGVTSAGGYQRDFVQKAPGSDSISSWYCSRDYRITYGE